MKPLYTLVLLFAFVAFSGCSKDFLKQYDDRVVGTWRIADVNRFGIGSGNDDVSFEEGNFTFNEDGTLTFTDAAGDNYEGRWDIRKKFTDGEDVQRSLQLSVANFANQQVRYAYYDDMIFLGTDHFRATEVAGTKRYMTHFRR